MGIWGAAELFWGFGEHKQNTFRELRQKLTGIWGDQSIIFRELGSKDPPLGGLKQFNRMLNFFKTHIVAVLCGRENVHLSAEGKSVHNFTKFKPV